MKKEKTSFKNILMYFLIIFFLFMIAIPPILRIVLKEEETVETPKLVDATALICKKEFIGTTNYKVSVTSSYKNNILNRIIFQYEKEEAPSTSTEEPMPNDAGNLVEQELANLRQNLFIEETTTENKIRFIMEKEDIEENSDNVFVKSYNYPIDVQKTNFTNNGYLCQQMTT